jgi:hypothetical protein
VISVSDAAESTPYEPGADEGVENRSPDGPEGDSGDSPEPSAPRRPRTRDPRRHPEDTLWPDLWAEHRCW